MSQQRPRRRPPRTRTRTAAPTAGTAAAPAATPTAVASPAPAPDVEQAPLIEERVQDEYAGDEDGFLVMGLAAGAVALVAFLTILTAMAAG